MLKEKNAIITGAQRGIGRATVEVFARNGANIWAFARKQDDEFEEDIKGVSDKYHVLVTPVYCDLNNEDELKNAIKSVVSEKRPIHILVNNAGIVDYNSFLLLPMNKVRSIMENNYIAPLRITQMVARHMAKDGSGASIVFLSSIAGLRGEDGNIAYGGSKAAVAHSVKVLSRELSGLKIRVNAVAPGLVNTSMKDKADEGYWYNLVDQSCLKREAEPEEIANVIAFLSSDLSSFVDGQIIRVDGGMQ